MSERREVAPTSPRVPVTVSLAPGTTLDLSHLSEQERSTLLHDYTRDMLGVAVKAGEQGMHVNTLRNNLDSLSAATKRAQEDGTSVTLTHTHTSPTGRTEISMGNTDAAKSGKLTKSQSGQSDWTPLYVVAAIVAVVVIALAFAK